MLEGFVDVSVLLRCGVYALAYRGEIVYIGQTRQGLTRLYTHRNRWTQARAGRNVAPMIQRISATRGVLFDAAYFQPCRPEQLREREAELIARYKPRLNTQLKEPGPISVPFSVTVEGQVLNFNQPAQAEPIRRRA